MLSLHSLVAGLATSSVVAVVNARACPPLGPVLLAPRSPSSSDAVKGAVEGLELQLEQTLGAMNASGVSIAVKSIHEKESIFNYHFSPQATIDISTNDIDENTIYRVGSVSKMFPALLALQLGVDLDASVLEFLPELGQDSDEEDLINTIQWKDISVRSLMSHMSGLPTHTSMDLTLLDDYPWTQKGLPKLPDGEGVECSAGVAHTRPCETADLLKALKNRRPVWVPYASSPGYSNVGYALLALVIEAATGEKFEDLVQKRILDVVGMDSTSFSGPVEAFKEHGFVPLTENTWNVTLGVFEAAGGMFSNTRDMIGFLEAIASNILLSAVDTREWMKPQAHTSSLSMSVGGPWEILRSESITSDGRVVDVYTKVGALGLYSALVGMIPDYDISFSVLTGGPEVAGNLYTGSQLTSAVIKSLIPAIEVAGKIEASRHSAGTYIDKKTNSTMKLELDDGSGLRVSELNVRGYNVLSNIIGYTLQGATMGGGPIGDVPQMYSETRLYPTDRVRKNGSAGNDTTETAWRAIFDVVPPEAGEQIESTLFYKDGTCDAWTAFDISAYNYQSIGEFLFTSTADGATTQISSPAFDVTLTKQWQQS